MSYAMASIAGPIMREPQIRQSGSQRIAHLSVGTEETVWNEGRRSRERMVHRVLVSAPGLIDHAVRPYYRAGGWVQLSGSLQYLRDADAQSAECRIAIATHWATMKLIRSPGGRRRKRVGGTASSVWAIGAVLGPPRIDEVAGAKQATFALRTEEPVLTREGTRRVETQVHTVRILSSAVVREVIEPYVHPGGWVQVVGSLQYEEREPGGRTAKIVVSPYEGQLRLLPIHDPDTRPPRGPDRTPNRTALPTGEP